MPKSRLKYRWVRLQKVVPGMVSMLQRMPVALRGLKESNRLRLVRLLPRVSKSLMIALATVTIGGALVSPAAIAARGFLVGSIPATLAAGGLHSAAGSRTIVGLVLVALLFVLSLLLSSIGSILASHLGMLVDKDLERRAMKALAAPPGLAHLEDYATIDKIAKIEGIGSANYRPGIAVDGLATRIRTWLSGLGAAILLAGFSWWVALAMSAVFIWAARVTLRHYISTTKILAGQAPTLRRSAYYRDQAFIAPTAKEVRIFHLQDWLLEKFRGSWFDAMKPLWDERGKQETGLRTASLAMGASAFAAALYVGTGALDGRIDIGQLTIFLGAIQGLFAFGQGYGPGDLQLEFGLSSLPVIEELEATSTGLQGGVTPENLPHDDISLSSVRFIYPGGETEVLRGVDMMIPAGKATAIVGANGAGKTTLIKLLCRFYDPQAGEIAVDGIPLESLDPRQWQKNVAAIFQDFIHYELPAVDNISFGSADTADPQVIRQAAERARALDLIEGLAQSWDTVLSRQVTGGVDISGGEWQRIALARALLAVEMGARILILDEPTANLDARAEAELYRSFLEITKGATTILISHRFSTVRRADLIYVLEDGTVTESGSHEELMTLNGTYARMFNLQAARFIEEQAGVAE